MTEQRDGALADSWNVVEGIVNDCLTLLGPPPGFSCPTEPEGTDDECE